MTTDTLQTMTAGAVARNDPAEAAIRGAIAARQYGQAVELLRAAYGRAIYQRAYRMLGDPSSAEDVVQDSLLGIYVGIGALRDGGCLRAWVMSVTEHRALDELRRRRRRRQRLAEGTELPDVADARPQPAHALAVRQEVRALTECVDALPPRIRASILLYFGGELTFEQVAKLLRETDGAVQVRVKRALIRLRAQLHRRGIARGGRAGRRREPVVQRVAVSGGA